MNATIKKLWLAALRSDEFEQGQGVMDSGNKLCCLGVLVRIACDQGVVKRTDDSLYVNKRFRGYGYGEAQSTYELPSEVVNWAGLSSPDPIVIGGSLGVHNDDGASFKKIADIIELEL